MAKLERAKQLVAKGRLSKADFGALQQISRGGFGGMDDGGGDGNEIPAAEGPEDGSEDEGAEGITPAMTKAGVAAFRSAKGKSPAALVTAIFKAMEAAEQG